MGLRILFDSHSLIHKTPFGTLVPGEFCAFCVHIPVSCRTVEVHLVLTCDRTGGQTWVPLGKTTVDDPYEHWSGEFSSPTPELYFYHFHIRTENEDFRIFRQGDHDTNMESGEQWQLTCVTDDFLAPDWARGAVMYQIFPDRFYKAGEPDLSEKLQPYRIHSRTDELPDWRPDAGGTVWNNDFFGGNLRGIADKMGYIASFGTEVLYLNPIFMAYSNHRYDTCDYRRVDPMLGTEEDFVQLCDCAHRYGIRVVLDGVFSHTGSNSVYFDREGVFGMGAYSCPDSPYRSWYRFTRYPEKYEAWWGFETLPALDKNNEGYRDFIFGADDCVVAHWLRLGADGFRLDVADELPDDFIAGIRRKMRQVKSDSLLLGEVWEDASNKIAYGVRRRYFADGELDGVMNYPWRTAILNFCTGKDRGKELKTALETIFENYPRGCMDCTMNLLSSHDRARVLTELAAPFEGSREDMAAHRLTQAQRELAVKRLKLAAAVQFFLPGMPSIYYGDEAGMEGCRDPFNRGFYPWGREDAELVAYFQKLGQTRKCSSILRFGDLRVENPAEGVVTILRSWQGKTVGLTADAATAEYVTDGELL